VSRTLDQKSICTSRITTTITEHLPKLSNRKEIESRKQLKLARKPSLQLRNVITNQKRRRNPYLDICNLSSQILDLCDPRLDMDSQWIEKLLHKRQTITSSSIRLDLLAQLSLASLLSLNKLKSSRKNTTQKLKVL